MPREIPDPEALYNLTRKIAKPDDFNNVIAGEVTVVFLCGGNVQLYSNPSRVSYTLWEGPPEMYREALAEALVPDEHTHPRPYQAAAIKALISRPRR